MNQPRSSKRQSDPLQIFSTPLMQRKIRFYKLHLLGMSLILLLPLLALFKVFSEETRVIEASAMGIRLQVEFPSLVHYKDDSQIKIVLLNSSSQEFPESRLHLDSGYLQHLSPVQIHPPWVHSISRASYQMAIPSLEPGGHLHVTIDIKANELGRHRGRVWLSSEKWAEIRGLEMLMETFILP